MNRFELPGDAWTMYDPAWLAKDEADAVLAQLLADEPWTQRPTDAGHKLVMPPRLMSWAGELPYRYSGQTLEPLPMSSLLADLMARVSAALEAPFNHLVLNRYRDGRDKLGMHSDNEFQLGRCPLIAAISVGAEREFVIGPKDKRSKRNKKRFVLHHGSLFVMGGAMQHTWWHGLPGTNEAVGERINITFRELKGPPGWREPLSPEVIAQRSRRGAEAG